MTVWNHGISWYRFEKALKCELQLQFSLDKRPITNTGPSYWRELGILVQYVFEQYYNQQINLKNDSPEVMRKVLAKCMKSHRFSYGLDLTCPPNLTKQDLFREIEEQVMNGHKIMTEMGMIKFAYESEKKWMSTFRNLRTFSYIDFYRETSHGVYIYDGKGHKEKNADPRQMLYYAMCIAATGRKVLGGGLIYWRHGYEPLDLSPAAIRDFIDGDFAKGREIFDRLKSGTSDFEANPSAKTCGRCNWSDVCEHSRYKKAEADVNLPEEFNLD